MGARHKYMYWLDEQGYPNTKRLLPIGTVTTLVNTLAPSGKDLHYTIQDYTETGECIGCPMYFDIDNESLYDSYHDMRALVDEIMMDYDVDPIVFFSGSKGFHVIVPLYIRHPRCHEIMRMIASEEYGHINVDTQVYRSFAMLRAPRSRHSSGAWKVVVSPTCGLDKILKLGNDGVDDYVASWNPTDLEIDDYVKRLPERTDTEGTYAGLQPCLKRLWSMGEPPQGYRHKVMHLMARHFFNSGLSQEEANAEFAHHHFFGSACARDVGNYSSVIRSVYTYGNAAIGCKHGSDADLLQQYCTRLCMFNDELKLGDLLCGTDSN